MTEFGIRNSEFGIRNGRNIRNRQFFLNKEINKVSYYFISRQEVQEVSRKPCFYLPPLCMGGGGREEKWWGRVEVGFENGNHFLLENMCVLVVGENLSAGNLKSHLTKIRTYLLLFPSWCPSRYTNQMCNGPIAGWDSVGQVFGIISTLNLSIRAGLWCLSLRLIPLFARARGLPARFPERNGMTARTRTWRS